jgi:hypothetical protein
MFTFGMAGSVARFGLLVLWLTCPGIFPLLPLHIHSPYPSSPLPLGSSAGRCRHVRRPYYPCCPFPRIICSR